MGLGKMCKYSIFGSKGRVGNSLVKLLQRSGNIEVFEVPRKFKSTKSEHLGHVIFAAGVTSDFRDRPYETMDAHVALLSDILNKSEFDTFTYLSSTRLYQNASSTKVDSVFTVNPNSPSDIYNLSKLSGEALCLQASDNVFVVRLSNVVGRQEVERDNFIGMISQQALNGKICFKTSAHSSKDYIWIDDVLDLLVDIPIKALKKIYNFASGQNITNDQWAKAFQNATGCDIVYERNASTNSFNHIEIEETKLDFDFKPNSVIEKIDEICELPS